MSLRPLAFVVALEAAHVLVQGARRKINPPSRLRLRAHALPYSLDGEAEAASVACAFAYLSLAFRQGRKCLDRGVDDTLNRGAAAGGERRRPDSTASNRIRQYNVAASMSALPQPVLQDLA